jgi:cell division septum initiation protein DivIVA
MSSQDHGVTQFLLLQAQQQVKELQQENEDLRQKIEHLQNIFSWRRIRKLSDEVKAGHQRFREAKVAAISMLSDILSDFEPAQVAEAVPLKRVFAIAIDEGDGFQRKRPRLEVCGTL